MHNNNYAEKYNQKLLFTIFMNFFIFLSYHEYLKFIWFDCFRI